MRKKEKKPQRVIYNSFADLEAEVKAVSDMETRMRLNARLWQILDADPLDLFYSDNDVLRWRSPDQLPPRILPAIEYAYCHRGVIKYKMIDKNRVSNLLCRLMGWIK